MKVKALVTICDMVYLEYGEVGERRVQVKVGEQKRAGQCELVNKSTTSLLRISPSPVPSHEYKTTTLVFNTNSSTRATMRRR